MEYSEWSTFHFEVWLVSLSSYTNTLRCTNKHSTTSCAWTNDGVRRTKYLFNGVGLMLEFERRMRPCYQSQIRENMSIYHNFDRCIRGTSEWFHYAHEYKTLPCSPTTGTSSYINIKTGSAMLWLTWAFACNQWYTFRSLQVWCV